MTVEDSMKEAVAKVLADKVVEALDGTQRESILAKGVAEVLGGYDMKYAYKKLIEDRAKEICRQVIESGKYDQQIREAFESAMARLMAGLEPAFHAAMRDTIFGVNGRDSYSTRPSSLLQHLDHTKA